MTKEIELNSPDKLLEISGYQKEEDIGVFTRRGQIESFWKQQPFFYDKAKLFWLWDKENYKWVLSDEVEFLNSIQKILGIETIDSKARIELTEGFKQIGRKHKPKETKKTWVQFKERIYDVKTGEEFEATPEYFITNPIPWNIGDGEETPEIDKLMGEWVVKEGYQNETWIKTLYEVMAYTISSNMFLQRIIGLCGGGSNGKGTYIKLLHKLIGEKENSVSSEIRALSENRFETFVLFRKLLCVMGEVSHDDLKNTNMLKKLAGEDLLSFQAKGKNSFTAENTATCICLTNSMPITPDKSLGYYRKWLLVDFPNQFKHLKEDLIEKIPISEFPNLARKLLRILKELYLNPEFTNEGTFEEREKRYEERSNPVMKFIEEFCIEEPGEVISLRDFSNKCNDFLKSKHLRVSTAIQIGQRLRAEGYLVGNRKIDDISSVVILNLRLKESPVCSEKLSKLSKLSNSQLNPYIETIKIIDSSDSSNSFKGENAYGE